MRRPRLLVALVAFLTAILATAAIAQTSTPGPVTTVQGTIGDTTKLVSTTLADTLGEQEQTLSYWTPERKAAAKPADRKSLPGLLDPVLGDTANSLADTPLASSASNQNSPRWTSGGVVASTVGKVYFTLGRRDYLCSATSVVSGSRNLLVTAGHCVNEGPGTFATNWIYVPGYSNGVEPYGAWTARQLHAPHEWTSTGNLDYDFGFVELNTRNGQRIGDAVGMQAIAFHAPRGQAIHSFGYPALAQYDGESLHLCRDIPRQDTYGGTGQGIACDMTEGSSGGPWFANFDPSTGVGTVVSVNSFSYEDSPGVMWGPYFGESTRALYDAVQG